MIIVFAIIVIVVLLVLVRCIVIVPQSNAFVVERLGVYKTTWEAGLHLKVPFLEKVARRVSLKEEVADFPPQPVITRDNVTMMIDTVVFFQVFDAKSYAYGVNRPIQAIENLSATTLRDIIGSMSLDETLTSRDAINTQITATLDEATDRWGIKVNRIELKNIEPPTEIRQAMEKQMKADREKRGQHPAGRGRKAGRHHPGRGRERVRHSPRGGCQTAAHPGGGRRGPGPAAGAEGPGRLHPADQRGRAHPEHAGPAQHGGHGEGGRRQGHQDHCAVRDAEPGCHRGSHPGHRRRCSRPRSGARRSRRQAALRRQVTVAHPAPAVRTARRGPLFMPPPSLGPTGRQPRLCATI